MIWFAVYSLTPSGNAYLVAGPFSERKALYVCQACIGGLRDYLVMSYRT